MMEEPILIMTVVDSFHQVSGDAPENKIFLRIGDPCTVAGNIACVYTAYNVQDLPAFDVSDERRMAAASCSIQKQGCLC